MGAHRKTSQSGGASVAHPCLGHSTVPNSSLMMGMDVIVILSKAKRHKLLSEDRDFPKACLNGSLRTKAKRYRSEKLKVCTGPVQESASDLF